MNQAKIAAGINYIKMLKQGANVYDIAEDVEETVEHVKDCIALARKNKDLADQKTKVILKSPVLDIKDEYYSGAMQVIKEVEVEIMKPIIIKYATDGVTEFQTLMPVTIKIKRI